MKIQGIILSSRILNAEKNFVSIRIKGSNKESIEFIKSQNGGQDSIDVIGTFFKPKTGSSVVVDGSIQINQRFGPQIRAKSIYSEVVKKDDYTKDILLSKTRFETRKEDIDRLFSIYGDYAVRMVVSNPSILIGNFGEAVIEQIKEDCFYASLIHNDYKYFVDLGIQKNIADTMINKFKLKARAVFIENPYCLLSIDNVKFKFVDGLARELGVKDDSYLRISHGVSHFLKLLRERGNTAFNRNGFVEKVAKSLSITQQSAYDFIVSKGVNGTMVSVTRPSKHSSLISNDGQRVDYETYLVDFEVYRKELFIASELKRIVKGSLAAEPTYQGINNHFLNKEQQLAVKNALFQKVSIITGGAGVGKTTVVNTIIQELKSSHGENHRFMLFAPTGKAARRMSEATGLDADTIHHGLSYSEDAGFRVNASNKLSVDTIIIDEMSMVDLDLFYQLILAIPNNARVIMVGDFKQIPSVSAGNVLYDLIMCGSITTTKLLVSNRQKEGANSLISKNANMINDGLVPELIFNKNSDFHWINGLTDEEILSNIIKLTGYITTTYNVKPENIQILSPQRETIIGVNNLNELIKPIFNPIDTHSPKASVSTYKGHFHVGDRVTHNKNDDDLGVKNGDVGVIKFIDYVNKKARIDYDTFVKDIPFSSFSNIDLAFANTLHKSQGSEYDFVIIPVSKSHQNSLTAQLMYTGITRGKKHVYLIGQTEAFVSAISNQDAQLRVTMLDIAVNQELSDSLKMYSTNKNEIIYEHSY